MDIFKTRGNQKGSCLLELLPVLAIIGISLSLGIPVYSIIIRKSRKWFVAHIARI